jgi:hypothetical protein
MYSLKIFATVISLLVAQAFADPFQDQIVSVHNAARAQYGASPLTWSQDLYPDLLQYTGNCKLQTSVGFYILHVIIYSTNHLHQYSHRLENTAKISTRQLTLAPTSTRLSEPG